jgi:hypothetical protein
MQYEKSCFISAPTIPFTQFLTPSCYDIESHFQSNTFSFKDLWFNRPSIPAD